MNRYLFVIDYQNDFVDGALGFPGAEKLDEKLPPRSVPMEKTMCCSPGIPILKTIWTPVRVRICL